MTLNVVWHTVGFIENMLFHSMLAHLNIWRQRCCHFFLHMLALRVSSTHTSFALSLVCVKLSHFQSFNQIYRISRIHTANRNVWAQVRWYSSFFALLPLHWMLSQRFCGERMHVYLAVIALTDKGEDEKCELERSIVFLTLNFHVNILACDKNTAFSLPFLANVFVYGHRHTHAHTPNFRFYWSSFLSINEHTL